MGRRHYPGSKVQLVHILCDDGRTDRKGRCEHSTYFALFPDEGTETIMCSTRLQGEVCLERGCGCFGLMLVHGKVVEGRRGGGATERIQYPLDGECS